MVPAAITDRVTEQVAAHLDAGDVCGPAGAGHFVKMVHNGIEYGAMAALAEGLNVLHRANAGDREHDRDAETAPLRDPAMFRYDFDTAQIAEVWRRGSVIGSWLLDLTATALRRDPELAGFAGRVSDSGEGRWTVQCAIDEGVPVPVLSAALFSRFGSRDYDEFANQVTSAMRSEFGGHDARRVTHHRGAAHAPSRVDCGRIRRRLEEWVGQRVAIAASVTRFATALPWIEALTAVGALSAPAIWAAGCRWSQESVRVSPTV